MPGKMDLSTLLSSLTVTTNPTTFVFATFHPAVPIPSTLSTHMTFREAEGTTVITALAAAEQHKIDYQYPCKMVTLNVHSSLEAVGFMAYITKKLSEKNISVNPVSGYFHDHLFVPVDRAEEVVKVLNGIAGEARSHKR